jgi:hypothetical protein
MCTEKKKWFCLQQNAREMCGGKYSDAASVACAEVTRAIANVSSSSLALSPSLSRVSY